ncbi:hypothetical protein PJ985_10095 [Streptomyces sp. ACA25]|uniref:hypothetical protein n=1 Tax=Streptomyces sp. ACA25 TaxID=3022596 RepID=UPI00230829DC|nr:hypothetical protein [Streptomyces sp. ACA25]MDB1087916.1 hypothetical protein [Streptomyces sp. ACA25]
MASTSVHAASPVPVSPVTAEPEPSSRLPSRVLTGVTLWRLLIVAFCFIGYGDVVARAGTPFANLHELSQLASVVTGFVYLGLAAYPLLTGGRRHEPRSGWLRGSLTVALMLVCIVYATMMESDYSTTSSLFTHVLTPLIVLIDWVAVGRNQSTAAWWYPLSWTLPLLAYLAYMVNAEVSSYSFIDPSADGFVATIAGFVVAVIIGGYVLLGLGRLRATIGKQRSVADVAPVTITGAAAEPPADDEPSDRTPSAVAGP